jgi:hypothetical protein
VWLLLLLYYCVWDCIYYILVVTLIACKEKFYLTHKPSAYNLNTKRLNCKYHSSQQGLFYRGYVPTVLLFVMCEPTITLNATVAQLKGIEIGF